MRRVNAPEGQVAASDIVVIDFQGVVRESTAAQAVQDQLASLRRAYQDEFGPEQSRT